MTKDHHSLHTDEAEPDGADIRFITCPSCQAATSGTFQPGSCILCPACHRAFIMSVDGGADDRGELGDGHEFALAERLRFGLALASLTCSILAVTIDLYPLIAELFWTSVNLSLIVLSIGCLVALISVILGIAALTIRSRSPRRYAVGSMAIAGICLGVLGFLSPPVAVVYVILNIPM